MSRASGVLILAIAFLALGAADVHGATEIILLANSIDYPLAQDFVDFLKGKGFEVTHVEAAAFDAYKTSKFIVILGGPDAPEGVGTIVQQHLSTSEQEHLRISGSREMYLRTYQDQRVFVIAGSDRAQTQQANVENRESIYEQVTAAEPPPITPPSPLPTGSKTIYAGEYVESISYWGFTKSDDYTMVRLQEEYVESSTTTITTKNSTVHEGTVQDAGPDLKNITLATSASSVDDYYNDMWIEITSGTGSGQVRLITDYNGTLRNATVDSDWNPLPTGGGYRILQEKSTAYVKKLRPGKFEYRTVYVTFKDSELPVKFLLEGVEYEILYYDNEKIIVKK